MAKKSLVRYVSEIREELLAKNFHGSMSISDSGSVAAKAVNANVNTVDSSAPGGPKRKPNMKSAFSSVLILGLNTLFSAITASATSKGQQAVVSMLNANATISQTSDSLGTLKETGVVANTGSEAASSDRDLDKVVEMSG